MRFNPLNAVAYRRRLAKQYLEEAEESFKRSDYKRAVESSQLAAENAAKAIIALYRVPSWSHDPSIELLELLTELPETIRAKAEKLADIAHRLAPEHGRVTYGEPTRGITPWELYVSSDGEKALNLARKSVKLLEAILEGLHIDL